MNSNGWKIQHNTNKMYLKLLVVHFTFINVVHFSGFGMFFFRFQVKNMWHTFFYIYKYCQNKTVN